MSPPPSAPDTVLKDERNCALTVSTLSVGWGEGVGGAVLVVRGYCPNTFVHDCSSN